MYDRRSGSGAGRRRSGGRGGRLAPQRRRSSSGVEHACMHASMHASMHARMHACIQPASQPAWRRRSAWAGGRHAQIAAPYKRAGSRAARRAGSVRPCPCARCVCRLRCLDTAAGLREHALQLARPAPLLASHTSRCPLPLSVHPSSAQQQPAHRPWATGSMCPYPSYNKVHRTGPARTRPRTPPRPRPRPPA